MKTILFLGDYSRQILPVILVGRVGIEIIICDHRQSCLSNSLGYEVYPIYSDDKEAVIELAKSKNVNGVVAYASDPAASTAIYVAGRLGLPGALLGQFPDSLARVLWKALVS